MIKDFTIEGYKLYLSAIKNLNISNLRFDEYLSQDYKPRSFFMIRHDVDRKINNSLVMARVEAEMGIKSSYYFRMRPNTFVPDIIKKISNLGHEIGYHYESLSDFDGNMKLALQDFKDNLSLFRQEFDIKTISMHGSPLNKYDNREIWRIKSNHDYLINEMKILGEVYLDIDYSEIYYINDTGRNWTSNSYNIRDRVSNGITKEFSSGKELLSNLREKSLNKFVFQIHPERWAISNFDYYSQRILDNIVNASKVCYKKFHGR